MKRLFRGRNIAILFLVVLFVLLVGTASTMYAYHKGAEFPNEVSSALAKVERLRTSKTHSSMDLEGNRTSDRSIIAIYHLPFPQMIATIRPIALKLGFKEEESFKNGNLEIISFKGPNEQRLYSSRGYYAEDGRLTGVKEYSTVMLERKANDFELKFDEFFHSGQYNEKNSE